MSMYYGLYYKDKELSIFSPEDDEINRNMVKPKPWNKLILNLKKTFPVSFIQGKIKNIISYSRVKLSNH